MIKTSLLPPLFKALGFSGIAIAISTAAFLSATSDPHPEASRSVSAAEETTDAAPSGIDVSPQVATSGVVEFEMDWPNHGTAYPSQTGEQIRGYVSEPGTQVEVQAWNPSSNAWEHLDFAVSSFEQADVPSLQTPAYAWTMPATVPSFWTTGQNEGGVLRLRAGPSPLPSGATATNAYDFDVDGPLCLLAQYAEAAYSRNMTWITAANHCQSPFPLTLAGNGWSGATVLSTVKTPKDLGRTFISMFPPTAGVGTINSDQIAANYYVAINPPTTLKGFMLRYGFTSTGANEVESTYYNKGDLGIGRNMHCRRFIIAAGSGLACYVKNYANNLLLDPDGIVDFGTDETGYLQAAIQKNRAHHFATVAMVQFDTSPRVDFIAYGAPDIRGVESRLLTALLDNTGANVAIPTNCISCHGGNYDGTATSGAFVNNARFLPFDSDPRILTFATGSLASAFPNFTRAAQAPKIRALNELIFNFYRTPAPVKKHIAMMYGDETAPTLGPNYAENYVPSDWNTTPASAKLYREVVKPYCIGCHVSTPADPASPDYRFASYNDFVLSKYSVRYAVCNAHNDRRMPAAEQTNTNFWKSPARAYLLNHLGFDNDDCKP